MSDINCPYCGAEQDINHDDGYGYSENEKHQQECENCDKTFVYETYITHNYDVETADCLNGGEHNWKSTNAYPVKYTKMRCTMCDEERKCTDKELEDEMTLRDKINNSF